MQPTEKKLRLEWMDPAELTANPKNYRRHPEAQLAALGDVIGEVGWAGACLYNERTNLLVDGHARVKIALEQGLSSIPVLVGSFDEATEAKILATLDNLPAMATIDKDAFLELLNHVQTESEAVATMLADITGKMNDSFAKQPQDEHSGEDAKDSVDSTLSCPQCGYQFNERQSSC